MPKQIIEKEIERIGSDCESFFPSRPMLKSLPVKLLLALFFPKFGVLYFHRKHKICKLSGSRHGYLYYLLNYYLNHVDIGPNCDIGSGVRFPHPLAVVIGDSTVINDNTTIMSCVTFGTNSAVQGAPAYPVVGAGCYIGTGAKVIGAVHIGSNAVVGANSVVLKSVPDGAVVAGVPAKNIR